MKENSIISIWEAMDLVVKHTRMMGEEELPIMDCLGRVLSRDILTAIDQPPFPRSAMDGYAIRSVDSKGACEAEPKEFEVVGLQCAGDPYFRPINQGEALRIMTGAAIPEGADCVIPQEYTDYGEERVSIYKEMGVYDNYCEIGEDFPQGDCLAQEGDIVDSYLIAAAIAAGLDSLPVRKKVRAAVITSGDELQNPGTKLKEGKIYNSNLGFFTTRLSELGCQIIMAESAGDSMDSIKDKISEASKSCDFIITTGGVSVGVKDLLPDAMEELGADLIFHGIAIKPGMPTMFSLLNGTPVLSLSGNPYSAAAVFELLAQPILRNAFGFNKPVLEKVTGISSDEFRKKTKWDRFLRGYYKEGTISFSAGQRNGQTRSGIGCNCLIYLENGRDPVKAGEELTAFLL